MVLELFRREGAGRSAERKYKHLARAWRRRVFGRRSALYFWTLYILLLLLVVGLHPGSRWALWAGCGFGTALAAWVLMPEALMPGHIFNWQLGAWGEQKTQSELKPLRREGWIVRHDTAWGKGNHDHILAGPAVYLLNSKNVPASTVTIESGGRLRVTQIDDPSNSYIADRWLPGIEREARSLKRQLDHDLGFQVAVYPVLVIWNQFEPGHQYVGNVAVVDGHELVGWLRSRPADLVKPNKRQTVADTVRALPSAGREPNRLGRLSGVARVRSRA
jgi:Nuclease-related domain